MAEPEMEQVLDGLTVWSRVKATAWRKCRLLPIFRRGRGVQVKSDCQMSYAHWRRSAKVTPSGEGGRRERLAMLTPSGEGVPAGRGSAPRHGGDPGRVGLPETMAGSLLMTPGSAHRAGWGMPCTARSPALTRMPSRSKAEGA